MVELCHHVCSPPLPRHDWSSDNETTTEWVVNTDHLQSATDSDLYYEWNMKMMSYHLLDRIHQFTDKRTPHDSVSCSSSGSNPGSCCLSQNILYCVCLQPTPLSSIPIIPSHHLYESRRILITKCWLLRPSIPSVLILKMSSSWYQWIDWIHWSCCISVSVYE